MVEVDIQFLAGVGATVFLALIFFAVVVLWDISLALRSVGDKIDKLEDNLDDDLKDIGYGINTLSNSPGGGTQLHLNSGGTISSGPGASAEEPRGESGPEQPHSAQSAHRPTRDPARSPRDEMDAQTEHPQTTDDSLGAEDAPSPEGSDEPVDDSAEQADDEEPATEDETATKDGHSSAAEESMERESASVAHPNAARNRGRFITSPDRTPWYRTQLDREAIAAGNKTQIAGALESPAVIDEDEADDDENDGDSAQTDSEDGEPEASAVYAAPPAHSSDQPEAITSEADPAVDDRDPEADDPSTETESALEDAVGDALEGIAASAGPTAVNDDERDGLDETAEPGDETPDTDRRSASGESRTITFDETELEESSEPTDDTADDAGSEMSDSADDGDETHAHSAADGSEDSTESDEDEPAADSTAPDPIPLDDALEALTEGGPELTFSSHGFDVSSVEDEDGVVLTFEFDPETVEIQGSTKRLLTYQLQSFADQASTPEGDVTIGEQRIVIEIPDADGNAIEQWGEAAVTSIDRTLYLSDSE